MKVLILISLLVASLYLSKKVQHNKIATGFQQSSCLPELKKNREAIDKYSTKHTKSIIIYVKVPGKRKLVLVKNLNWPDEIEYTYDIYKNPTGKIIFIAQIPYSESGDWSIVCKHYFDENGNTFSFNREESIFDDNVAGGIVREKLTMYYDINFHKIGEVSRLTDKDNRPLGASKKKGMYNFRDYEYKIYKNLSECLTAYNIPLAN